MRKKKWRAEEVVHALRVAYGVAQSQLVTDEWSFLTEVPLRAPRRGYYSSHVYDESYWSNTRTIDILLTRNWSSGIGFQRVAIEVKVSKSDYRNESDLKRAPAERAAHVCYYAAPAGIIDPDTLPEGWGLFEVYETWEEYQAAKGWHVGQWQPTGSDRAALVKCRVRPAKRTPQCSLDYLVSAGMRRASRAEERIRRGGEDAAEVPALRSQVARLEGQLERRDDAIVRERMKVAAMRADVLAMAGGQVCSDCEEPIRYDRTKRNSHGVVWVHDDPEQEGRCAEARAEADRLRKEAEYGSRYTRGWADPVWPKDLREAAQAERVERDAERAARAAELVE